MKQLLIAIVLSLFSFAAFADGPSGPPSTAELGATIKTLKGKKELKAYFKSSYAYAVFPRVGRGAFGVGGAFGEGAVFQRGKEIGTSKLMQLSIGLGAGGEQYTEIVFFKDKKALERFIQGNVEMDAHATAVAADKGVGGALGYNNGVAVMTYTKVGLMADAAVGGQKFTFEKK